MAWLWKKLWMSNHAGMRHFHGSNFSCMWQEHEGSERSVLTWLCQVLCLSAALWHPSDVQTHPWRVGGSTGEVGSSQGAPKEEPGPGSGPFTNSSSKALGTCWFLNPKPGPVPSSPRSSDAATSQHNTDSGATSGHPVASATSSAAVWDSQPCPVLLGSCSQQSSAQPELMSPSYHCLWTCDFPTRADTDL